MICRLPIEEEGESSKENARKKETGGRLLRDKGKIAEKHLTRHWHVAAVENVPKEKAREKMPVRGSEYQHVHPGN